MSAELIVSVQLRVIWGFPQRLVRIERKERTVVSEDLRKQACFRKPCQVRIPPSPPSKSLTINGLQAPVFRCAFTFTQALRPVGNQESGLVLLVRNRRRRRDEWFEHRHQPGQVFGDDLPDDVLVHA